MRESSDTAFVFLHPPCLHQSPYTSPFGADSAASIRSRFQLLLIPIQAFKPEAATPVFLGASGACIQSCNGL
eukprot:1161515-Pelagomonas_calceolata.AAC.14